MIERGEKLHGLYEVTDRINAGTDLSFESVRYYASLVDYYAAINQSQLKIAAELARSDSKQWAVRAYLQKVYYKISAI